MAPKQPRLIRVLLIQEGDFWVAQGLEIDIAAQGRDVAGAQRAFVRTLIAQAGNDTQEGREPLAGMPPAPDWYFEAYEAADEQPEFLRDPQLRDTYIAQAISDQHVAA